MRVIINQMAALGWKTGVGHYAGQLLRCLRAQSQGGQIDSFPLGGVRQACKAFVRARPYFDNGSKGGSIPGDPTSSVFSGLRSGALKYLRQGGRAVVAHYFRSACARENYDLYHEPNFIPFACDRPTVVTLHDMSVILHPEWHPADRVAFYEQNFLASVANCAHFLAVSEFSRQELIRTLNVPPDRVTVTYNGIRPGLRPLQPEIVAQILHDLQLPPRYLLYVGTIEPRKNVLTLLHAYCALPADLRDRWPLLLVGKWGWKTEQVSEFFHSEARHRGVMHVGYVSDAHLPAVYNGARALVYPSLYEGFGLPPLEMMACGGAVLASTAEALVETVGQQAHLVAPQDLDGWQKAMSRVLVDEEWWRDLRRGTRTLARPFTWERCAAETLAVYRSICGLEVEVPEAPVEQERHLQRLAG